MHISNIFKGVCSLNYVTFSKSSDPPLQPQNFKTSEADFFLEDGCMPYFSTLELV